MIITKTTTTNNNNVHSSVGLTLIRTHDYVIQRYFPIILDFVLNIPSMKNRNKQIYRARLVSECKNDFVLFTPYYLSFCVRHNDDSHLQEMS